MRKAYRLLTIVTLLTLSQTALADNPKVKIETNYGEIVLELFSDKAPLTVDNFLQYVDSGFYNNTIFHRVIKGFMVQGGGFDIDYMQKPTRAPVKNEANNGLENLRGTVAMARTPQPHSATAQFFINTVDNSQLNYRFETPQGWGYAVFGKVTDGMDIVDEIAETPTGPAGPFRSDAPQAPIIIEKISRLEKSGRPSGKPAAPGKQDKPNKPNEPEPKESQKQENTHD